MEDRNMLAADCVVISCCCQCLILQIVVFILFKVPYKLGRKMKKYAKRKLVSKKRDEKMMERQAVPSKDEFAGVDGGSLRIQAESFAKSSRHGGWCCMEEVEKVLEELSQKGEFAFGSFWGRDKSGRYSVCLAEEEFDYNVLHCHLIEMVGSFSYT